MDMNSIWFAKLNRFSAWVLLVAIALYFVSGYAKIPWLHSRALPLITLIVFFFHTFFSIRMAMMRWKIWNRASAIILLSIYLGFFGLLIKLDYKENKPTTATETTITKSEKIFTLEELGKYDGKNGNKAYVAIDGLVYDMTSVFRNGSHHGYSAGIDQTEAFNTQHGKDILTRFTIVGKIK